MANTTRLPQHGDERGTIHWAVSEAVRIIGGELMLRAGGSGYSYSIHDRYCGWCRQWKTANGLPGGAGACCVTCGRQWTELPTMEETDAT